MGIAPSTARAYASVKSRYASFCSQVGLQQLPLSDHCLCAFVSYLALQGVQHQSIKCYLSALRHLQIEAGLPDPLMSAGNFPRLEYVLKGVKRSPAAGRHSRRRLPITPSILVKL